MTLYSVYSPTITSAGSYIQAAQSIALCNGNSKAVRITKIDFFLAGTGGGAQEITVARWTGSTISGGSQWFPKPLRETGNPTGVVARGRLLNYNGSTYVQGSAVTVTGSEERLYGGSVAVPEFPQNVTIGPGSTLYVATPYANSAGTTTYFGRLIVYFNEERLSLST